MVTIGTENNDTLLGTSGNDAIAGLEADDLIFGDAGNDTMYGGVDNLTDSLVVGGGDDVIFGGEGDDLIFNSFGNDELYGGSGNDTLVSEESFIQTMGSNLLDGGEGRDKVVYLNTRVSINLADGTVTTESDFVRRSDRLANIEDIEVTGSDSKIIGDGKDNSFSGTHGNDTIYGAGGDDTIDGFGGSDILGGDGGNDFIRGRSGSDTLMGTSSHTRGRNEVDILEKMYSESSFLERETDSFVLGDRDGAYYTADGDGDYAEIINFQSGVDKLMLHGAANQYEISTLDGTTRVSYVEADNSDLIAILKSNTDINLAEDAVYMN